ncbi:MAG: ABC transporter ATP-binding protein [Humibacillus sp.]|nr:ABC transporter ATP-binding protein [Humibacillus sp.]MDN5775321.1 ABC transporter ATP-binding protein [Humibacillus sp.]
MTESSTTESSTTEAGFAAAGETAPADLPAPRGGPAEGPAVAIRGLGKRFGDVIAVKGIDLDVPRGSFFGLVGPNGAGKTTTLSMVTGLLRPTVGQAFVLGRDVWADPVAAKRLLGILPDGLRTFDRLTGLQLITYSGLLRGMPRELAAERATELVNALGLASAQGKLVVDYSAGMTKKVTLASALIHGPRVLVLDEPFEAVDPVSSATIRSILGDFVESGGTVILSSHVMDLVERLCSHVAVIADGQLLAHGALDDVRAGQSLEQRFVSLVGGTTQVEGLSWLRTSSD